MKHAKKLIFSGTRCFKRWVATPVISACLLLAACEKGTPSVATIHLNCVDGPAAQCEQLDSGDGKTLVEQKVLLSDQDFARIELKPEEVGDGIFPILAIEFSERAGDTLWQTTSANVGRRLIFVVDGHVLSNAKILEPVHGVRAQLVLDVTREEAEGLVARIMANRGR